jgi:2-amino-4-hydroxy-6-hydroxymethyldihydropteridine diphosphokinase
MQAKGREDRMARAGVYLALGTNLGDRQAHLEKALEQVAHQVTLEARSSVYETEPAYVTDQPQFFNLVVRGSTTLTPHELLHFLKHIEQDLGRVATVRYGPRVIDLDILLYGDLELGDAELTIPHPRITERAFVLVPLAEIAPNLHIPGKHATAAVLARRAGQHGEVVRVVLPAGTSGSGAVAGKRL